MSVLMLSGIPEIAGIRIPIDQHQLRRLLGDGGQRGLVAGLRGTTST
jgi:hypothetical protein